MTTRVETRTADGHEVRIGETYWDYNLDRSTVVGVSHDDHWDNGRVVRWYNTVTEVGGRRGLFDGSRLSVRKPF